MPVSIARQRQYLGGSLRSPEWLAKRHLVLERDGNACKRCRVPNRRKIARGIGNDRGFFMYMDNTVFVPCIDGSTIPFHDLSIYHEDTGSFFDIGMEGFFEYEKRIEVVLTIAHLDHDPRNNDLDNLAALCQLHHNRHDAKVRADRRRMRHNMDLFLDGVA